MPRLPPCDRALARLSRRELLNVASEWERGAPPERVFVPDQAASTGGTILVEAGRPAAVVA